MPNYLLPRNQGAHRIAAIALYRTLLAQCRALPELQAPRRHELQNIVRNRFRQARHTSSQKWLKYNFEAGYEALDHLDAAVAGDEDSRSKVLQLLENAPAKTKQDPPMVITKRLQKTIRQRDRERNGPCKVEDVVKPSIFDRPLPLEQLAGRRRVPVLFNAQGIPVLRTKKPQPPSLSGYLADKLRQRTKRHDLRHRLDEELNLARMEDEWDRLVSTEQVSELPESDTYKTYQERREQREQKWSNALISARQEVLSQLNAQRQRNIGMRDKMMEIVAKERALCEQEKAERNADRRQRWLEQSGQTGLSRD